MNVISQPARKRGRPLKGEGATLRRELIAKSAKLFREQGYERTTVRDIAAAAGIQAGSWFYYFKTKQDILAAVMEEGMSSSLARIEALQVDNLPAREAFHALVSTHLRTMLKPDHDFIPVLLYEWKSLDAGARGNIIALKDRYEVIWDSVIARLQASGEWPSPTPIDRLLMFGALNWIIQWYKTKAGLSFDVLVEHAVTFSLRTANATIPSNIVT